MDSNSRMKRSLAVVVLVPAVVALIGLPSWGFSLGWQYFARQLQQNTIPWKPLNAPPEAEFDFLDVSVVPPILFIRGASGTEYGCDVSARDSCWYEAEWPHEIKRYMECSDISGLKQPAPPGAVAESSMASACESDYIMVVEFVRLEKDGGAAAGQSILWSWHYDSTNDDSLMGIFVYPLGACLIGLLLGGGIMVGAVVLAMRLWKRPEEMRP